MRWLIEEESGQSMVEYALLIMLVTVALVTAINAVGTGLTVKFEEIKNALP